MGTGVSGNTPKLWTLSSFQDNGYRTHLHILKQEAKFVRFRARGWGLKRRNSSVRLNEAHRWDNASSAVRSHAPHTGQPQPSEIYQPGKRTEKRKRGLEGLQKLSAPGSSDRPAAEAPVLSLLPTLSLALLRRGERWERRAVGEASVVAATRRPERLRGRVPS